MDQNVPLGSYKDDSVASPVTTTSAALLVKTVGRYNIIKYDGKFYGVPHGVPVDWTTVGRYNIIKYDDKFYGVPLGAPVDWTKDYLTEVPGMIIDASVEKVELAIKNRLTFDSPNAPPPSPAASGMFPLAEELASRGIAFLPRIGAQAIDEILAYFKTRKTCYDSYAAVLTDGTPHRYAELSGSRPFASYALRDVLAAPHLMRFATHPLVLDSVESFLGGPASIYSVNVWWSFPGHAAARGQEYHRDKEAPKFCTLFVYLTDTTTETGAHIFLPGTQRVESCEPLMRRKAEELGIDYETIRATAFEAPNDCYGNDDLYEAVFGEIKLTVEGPAGLAFLEDNSGLHKGIPPRSEPRLCFWARFGIGLPDWTGVFPRDSKKFVARYNAGFPPHPELDGILVDDRTAHVLRFINRDIHLDLAFE